MRVLLGGKEYSPVDISARILGKLKEDAEFRLGEPVTHAVITVPAYFSQVQKADTRRAGLKAGLNVIKILDEPTAAAVAYGIDQAEDGNPKTILVYDLGGGTFDISVLMMSGGTFLTLNTEGDMWLGGDNFDQAIVEFAVKQIKDEYGIDPSDNERFMVTLKKRSPAGQGTAGGDGHDRVDYHRRADRRRRAGDGRLCRDHPGRVRAVDPAAGCSARSSWWTRRLKTPTWKTTRWILCCWRATPP